MDLRLARRPVPEPAWDEIVPLCRSVRAWSAPATEQLARLLPRPARPCPELEVTALVPTCRREVVGLRSLLAQDLSVRVILLHNGSVPPPTLPLGVEMRTVSWEGHGPTRQRAAECVRTRWVLFTVDDAVLVGPGCLRTLVNALEEGGYDAVYARQIPWPDADPVTRARLRAWTPPGTAPRPSPQVDHVATLLRRETLLRHPLPPVPIAEDLWWSRGRRVACVPTAAVVHAHRRRPGPLFARTRAIHRQLLATGAPPRVSSFSEVLRAAPSWLRATNTGPWEPLNQAAEVLGQWYAYRDTRAGFRDPEPPPAPPRLPE